MILKIFLLLSTLLIGFNYSLLGPFYPIEAEKHGLTPAYYGLVFGIYELSGLFVSIPLGKYMVSIGTKFVFQSGLFLVSGSTCIFGFLQYVTNTEYFFAYSIICRLFQSFSENGVQMAVLAVINKSFNKNRATLIGWTETMLATGLVVGPFIGSYLYTEGGFLVPLTLFGGIAAVLGVMGQFIIPDDDTNSEEETQGLVSITSVFSLPSTWIGFLCTASCGLMQSTIIALLEPYVSPLNFSVTFVGFLLLLNGLGYITAAPIYGRLCDKGYKPGTLMLFAIAFSSIGASLIGPLPFLPLSPSLPLLIPGLFINGVGLSGQMLSPLVYMKEQCKLSGLGETADVENLVAGIWISGFSLGGFIGPTVGGVLFDTSIGFRNITMGMVIINLLLLTFMMILKVIERRKSRHENIIVYGSI